MQGEQIQVHLGNYKYTQRYCIGQGSFGKVYRGVNIQTGHQVAIKQMDSKQITLQQISTEISILKQLRHNNIVEYEDAFQNNGFFYIITQYCKGGDLRNAFQDSDQSEEESIQQKERKILKMVQQVCEGFQYLRQHNIIHRDLKPSNIMIHQGRYKIGDFGLARSQSVHKSVINQQLMGVPIYMSPQILSKNYYTYKCDVWSLGIIIYQMFFDILPWKAQDAENLFFNIMKHPFPYLEGKKKLPKIILFLLNSTLQYLQKDRLSWSDLLYAVRNINSIGAINLTKQPSLLNTQFTLPTQPHKSIPRYQLQVLSHIFNQAKCIQPQLIKLTTQDAYKMLLSTIIRYEVEGQEKVKSLFNDTIFMYLKVCGENLHMFMIELETLEDGRLVLVFLQLLHDFVFASQQPTQQGFKKKIALSNSNMRIDQFAAQVISKINTFAMSREFDSIPSS